MPDRKDLTTEDDIRQPEDEGGVGADAGTAHEGTTLTSSPTIRPSTSINLSRLSRDTASSLLKETDALVSSAGDGLNARVLEQARVVSICNGAPLSALSSSVSSLGVSGALPSASSPPGGLSTGDSASASTSSSSSSSDSGDVIALVSRELRHAWVEFIQSPQRLEERIKKLEQRLADMDMR